MQRGVPRVPAIIEKRIGGFVAGTNLSQCGLMLAFMIFTEMKAKSALSFVNLRHGHG